MPADINLKRATAILLEEASRAANEPVSAPWEANVTRLSEACERASRTHIAFLGTALLAKATDPAADAFGNKASDEHPGAYSARRLAHGVLVPNAPLLGINLGVTGREPLNNQPYFRVLRATPEQLLPLVRGVNREPVEILSELLAELDRVTDPGEIRAALRAFIHVRRQYLPAYKTRPAIPGALTLEQLVALVQDTVGEDSEGGKRAQAVAAGMLDLFAGPERVETGRINDPSRHMPGDVGVRSVLHAPSWERIFEVRDKPVAESDLIFCARKAAEAGVTRAAMLAVAAGQKPIEPTAAREWAAAHGVALTVFWGWEEFIRQAVFWSQHPRDEAVAQADGFIRARLIEAEASPEAVEHWDASPLRSHPA